MNPELPTRRTACATLLWGTIAAISVGDQAIARQRPSPKLRLLVPAYFYPAGDGLKEWDRLLASKGLEHTIIIVNPASSAGTQADPNYTRLLERAGKTRATLIGYVTTSYAKRTPAEVKADVDQWLRLYPSIRGIFFDEQASGEAHLDYYRALFDYAVKEKKLPVVVSNPGTLCHESYLAKRRSETFCLFEGPYKPGCLELPAWTRAHSPASKYLLPYDVKTSDTMKEIVRGAPQRGVGMIYVTDASGVNPWDRLPTYWEEQVAEVQAVNGR